MKEIGVHSIYNPYLTVSSKNKEVNKIDQIVLSADLPTYLYAATLIFILGFVSGYAFLEKRIDYMRKKEDPELEELEDMRSMDVILERIFYEIEEEEDHGYCQTTT